MLPCTLSDVYEKQTSTLTFFGVHFCEGGESQIKAYAVYARDNADNHERSLWHVNIGNFDRIVDIMGKIFI